MIDSFYLFDLKLLYQTNKFDDVRNRKQIKNSIFTSGCPFLVKLRSAFPSKNDSFISFLINQKRAILASFEEIEPKFDLNSQRSIF